MTYFHHEPIETVAVIGSGVMGAAIAAHVANAGVQVLLFDLATTETGRARNEIARNAIDAMPKARPPMLMDPSFAESIQPLNLEDDLSRLAECDWVIEAVAERLDIKAGLYRRMEEHLGPDTLVSSNTSTFSLAQLLEGRPQWFRKVFSIVHFFNPPRYMRLVELVALEDVDVLALGRVRHFLDVGLGKSVIACKDSPGFIANRIGSFFVETAVQECLSRGLSPETTDAVCGLAMGMPRSGVFGLLDLVGIDLFQRVARSLRSSLAATDALQASISNDALYQQMIERDRLGAKSKGQGFYWKQRDSQGKKQTHTLDLIERQYRPHDRSAAVDILDFTTRDALDTSGELAEFARTVLLKTLAYTAEVFDQVAYRVSDVDQAMRLGYGWRLGPFEMIDRLGADWVAVRLSDMGLPIPSLLESTAQASFYQSRDAKTLELCSDGNYQALAEPDAPTSLESLVQGQSPLQQNASAKLWNAGNGVAVFEITTKACVLNQQVFGLLLSVLDMAADPSSEIKAIVIYSDGPHFAAGADVSEFDRLLVADDWDQLRAYAQLGQDCMQSLQRSKVPVVAAIKGAVLGGGCELAMHATAVQAHAELTLGLVETSVGILPAWGGCAEVLARAQRARPEASAQELSNAAFELIGHAKVCRSAAEARRHHYLRDSDRITMNLDRLLPDAIALAESLLQADASALSPDAEPLRLPGGEGLVSLSAEIDRLQTSAAIDAHQARILKELAAVLCGGDGRIEGPVPPARVRELEIEHVLRLFATDATQKRISRMANR